MNDKILGACQCHEKHAPAYWEGVFREYKDALEKAEKERDEAQAEREEMRESLHLMADSVKSRATKPRPLTPDAIEVALHDCMPGVAFDRLSATQVMRLAEDMHAALTEPRPLAPGDATDAQIAAAYRAGRFALADWLAGRADRIAEGMNR